MFSNLKNLFASEKATPPDSLEQARIEKMVETLGEPDHIDKDTDTSMRVDIYAFGRNFIEECETDADDDEGYVLVTSGMSDHLMSAPEGFDGEESLAVELIWYVRDLNPEYFKNLRWLAKLPFMDKTWFGLGHTVPMPKPPLSFSPLQTFLFLPPIISRDRFMFDDLESQGQSVETLVVHLISAPEYHLIKTEDGLSQFLNLLDEKGYPPVFDPARKTIVD